MKLDFDFRNWCNKNKGVFEFIALILIAIELFRSNSINLTMNSNLLQKIGTVLSYNIKIPFFIFIILILLIVVFLVRYRKNIHKDQKSTSSMSSDILVGTWKCDWGKGSEICMITPEGKYYVENEYWLNIVDLKIDASTGYMTFFKVGVRPDDKRRLFTELSIVNNTKLEGKENGKKISYSRLN